MCGPDRSDGRNPNLPESPDRPRCGGGPPGRAESACPRLRRSGPELPPSQGWCCLLSSARQGQGRDAATAGGRERAASPAWLSQLGARAGQGHRVRGSGGSRCLPPPPPPPPPGPRSPRGSPPGPHGGEALGIRPERLHPEGRPGSARAPRPSPGRWDYFRGRPRPAPCPRAAERSALRRRRQDTAALA